MDTVEDAIRRAAEQGARFVTSELQVVRDAADHTVHRWRSKGVRQGNIADAAAWAFCVGKNAARELASKLVGSIRLESFEFLDTLGARAGRSAVSPEERDLLRNHIIANEKKLRGRQFAVVLKLTEPGMSLHRAAQELGMPRWSLKRSFRGALRCATGDMGNTSVRAHG